MFVIAVIKRSLCINLETRVFIQPPDLRRLQSGLLENVGMERLATT